MGTGLLYCPLCLVEGKTHFASINSFVQDSIAFSEAAALRRDDRTWAEIGLALVGMNGIVRH